MVSCVKCDVSISGNKDSLQCCECKGLFHPECSRVLTIENYKKMSAARKSTWKCDSCVGETSSNVSASSKGEDDSKVMSFLKDLRKDMTSQFSTVQSNFNDVKSQIQEVNGRIDTLNTSVSSLFSENEQRQKETKDLKEANDELREDLRYMRQEVLDLQQYTRRNNLEIVGVPTTPGEDIYALLKSLANYLHIKFAREEISVAHRLPPRRPQTEEQPDDKRRDPTIIVSLISRSAKDTWRNAAKGKQLRTEDLHRDFPKGRLFINDHLTVHNKAVLGRARSYVREGWLVGAWTTDCRVMVKREAESRPARVRTIEELDRMLRPTK